MSELRDNRMSTYVEDSVKEKIQRYAEEHGMTESQAIRHLTRLGLRMDVDVELARTA